MFQATKKVDESAPPTKGTVIASLAALGSVVLASSCCLPLIPFLFAAGAAGTSAFFVKLRPFLMALSVLVVGFGFYQAWQAKKCNCRPSVLSTILLWLSLVVVLVFLLFPQAIATVLATALTVLGLLLFYQFYAGSNVPPGQPPLVRLNDSNLSALKDNFNQSARAVRLLVMLSPT